MSEVDAMSGGSTPGPRRMRGPRRLTSADSIYEVLLGEIVSLILPPGTPLQEKRLLERFGVSRTPVREALIRLSEAGLVDIYPQSGTFVSRVPVGAIPEAVLIRKALEGVSVEAAAAVADPSKVARLDDTIERQKFCASRGDTAQFHEADEAFHEAIAEIGGHPGVWRLLRQVKVQIDRARRLTLPALGRMDQVIAEHTIIRNAIENRDAKQARDAMMVHLSAVIPDIDRLRDDNPHYFE